MIKVVTQQRGMVLAEFSFVLVLVLSLGVGFIEFTRLFGLSQSVSQLSRELANIAYRECSFLPEASVSGNRTVNQCINAQAVAAILALQQAQGMLSGEAQVRLRVYRFDAGAVVLAGDTGETFSSPFDPTRPRFATLVSNAGVVTVAEVVLPVDSLFAGFTPLYPGELYEATIF